MKKSALWLSHFVPYPPKGGCFQRSYNLIRQVAKEFDVHLLAVKHKATTHSHKEIEGARSALEDICASVTIVDISTRTSGFPLLFSVLVSFFRKTSLTVSLYNNPEIRRALNSITSQCDFDIVHFDSISFAGYSNTFPQSTKILNHHGAEAYMMRRRIRNERNLLKKAYFFFESKKLDHDEKESLEKFVSNIVVSELDRDILFQHSPKARYTIIENGVDTEFFDIDHPTKHSNRIIFVGSLDNYSNRDAVLWFCRKVWPLLKTRFPRLRFDIVGGSPPSELLGLSKQDPSISVHGYVDDVRELFRIADASIVPIRDGGGTRIKVLDAFSMRTPLIATSIGTEGLQVIPDEDFLLANTPAEFVDKTRELYAEPDRIENMVRNARKKVEQMYSWDVIGRKLNELYKAVT